MKRTIVMILGALVALVGCHNNDMQNAPLLYPAVESIDVPSTGDICEVAYRIENPVPGAVIQPSSNAEDWIVNYDTSTEDVLRFEVLPNIQEGEVTIAREATVTVVYSYPSGASSFTLTVGQAGSDQSPVLTLVSDSTMSVLSNARQHTVYYELSGEIDGGEFTVYSDVDWITVPEGGGIAADSVNFNVDVNTSEDERQGYLFLEYVWPDGNRTEKINVTQASGHIYFEAAKLEGYYYGNTVDPVNNQYFFYLTDKGFDDYGYAYANSVYFNIDLRVSENADIYSLGVPAGTYEFIEKADAFPAGVFTTQNGYIVNGDPYVEDMVGYREGRLTVERDGAVHDVTLDLVLADGRVAHVTFNGEVELANESGQLPSFSGEVVLTPTECIAQVYTSDNGGRGPSGGYYVDFHFTDSKTKEDGTPADVLTVYAILDMDDEFNEFRLPLGDLPVQDDISAAPGNLWSGSSLAMFGNTYATGTYVTRYDGQGRPLYSLVSGGYMRMVIGDDGVYTFEVDMTSESGDRITGTYSGPVRIDSPGSFSTLTEDKVMDMSSIKTGAAIRNGGSMNAVSTGNWQIELLPEYGRPGDGMTIEICTGVDSDDISTIAGIYTADITGGDRTFVIGQRIIAQRTYYKISSLQGTGYVGDFSRDGLACSLAPAMDGTIEIADNGDGTFTITMTGMIDDNEPAFSFNGSWTGTLTAMKNNDENSYVVYSKNLNDADMTASGPKAGGSGTIGGTGALVSWRL